MCMTCFQKTEQRLSSFSKHLIHGKLKCAKTSYKLISRRILIAFAVMFGPMTYLKFYMICGGDQDTLIFSHKAIQTFLAPPVRVSFLHSIALGPLSKINWPHVTVIPLLDPLLSYNGLSILRPISHCLNYYSFINFEVLQILFFKTALNILNSLYFHCKF